MSKDEDCQTFVFESTTNTPVTFNIKVDGKELQSVTVSDNFNSETLYIGGYEDSEFEVIATTSLWGTEYKSAPLLCGGSTKFLAQVLQISDQGTYDFNVVMSDVYGTKMGKGIKINYDELAKTIYTTTIESYNDGTSPLRQVMRIRQMLEAVARETLISNQNEDE